MSCLRFIVGSVFGFLVFVILVMIQFLIMGVDYRNDSLTKVYIGLATLALVYAHINVIKATELILYFLVGLFVLIGVGNFYITCVSS